MALARTCPHCTVRSRPYRLRIDDITCVHVHVAFSLPCSRFASGPCSRFASSCVRALLCRARIAHTVKNPSAALRVSRLSMRKCERGNAQPSCRSRARRVEIIEKRLSGLGYICGYIARGTMRRFDMVNGKTDRGHDNFLITQGLQSPNISGIVETIYPCHSFAYENAGAGANISDYRKIPRCFM